MHSIDGGKKSRSYVVVRRGALLERECGTCLGVDRTAGAIRGRSVRVIDVVTSEMEKYEPGEYTEGVLESVRVLRDQSKNTSGVSLLFIPFSSSPVLPSFAERIKIAVDTLRTRSAHDDGKVTAHLFRPLSPRICL